MPQGGKAGRVGMDNASHAIGDRQKGIRTLSNFHVQEPPFCQFANLTYYI
ncbi:hypothetical protein SDC9_149840 [bioreactor metagenome]|uniref:Uncharacterized protein n=1 Tax=bioreactor metagenome TaxID=1076179 RepID=A0A645EPT9_9ZZZZ